MPHQAGYQPGPGRKRLMLLWHEIEEDGSVDPTALSTPLPSDSPRTKRRKIVKITEDVDVNRIIASPDDLDVQEMQLCLSILYTSLKAVSPYAQATPAIFEAFLAAVFDGWTSATTVHRIPQTKKLPIQALDGQRWHTSEAPMAAVHRTNKKGKTELSTQATCRIPVKLHLTYVVQLRCDPLSLHTSMCFVDKNNKPKMKKVVKCTDLAQARWVFPRPRPQAERELHEVVLTRIVGELKKAYEALAISRARRALYQRSRGVSHFRVDLDQNPSFQIDQILTALPTLARVCVPILKSVELFSVLKAQSESASESESSVDTPEASLSSMKQENAQG